MFDIITNPAATLFDITANRLEAYYQPVPAGIWRGNYWADSATLTIADLAPAMRPGKVCRVWRFEVSDYYVLPLSEAIRQAFPGAETAADFLARLFSGEQPQPVEGLTVRETEQ